MRSIPVNDFIVIVTAAEVPKRGAMHWRGHWSVHPRVGEFEPSMRVLAQGDTDLFLSEENAYLFAGAEGVASAKELLWHAGDA